MSAVLEREALRNPDFDDGVVVWTDEFSGRYQPVTSADQFDDPSAFFPGRRTEVSRSHRHRNNRSLRGMSRRFHRRFRTVEDKIASTFKVTRDLQNAINYMDLEELHDCGWRVLRLKRTD